MDKPDGPATGRRESLTRAARDLGLLGAKERQMGGRFPEALVDAAKRASGIAENTDLLTYGLLKVALEDDFGDRLLKRKGTVPKGSLEG